MKVSERSVLDRRTFVKGMLAAGATVTVAACAPVAAPSAPAPAAPVAPPTVVGPAWIHPKSLVRAVPGYGGGHLSWKYGDTVKWLPPEKIPQSGAASDAFSKMTKEKMLLVYRKMERGRQWETDIKDLFLAGTDKLYGYAHQRVGQEAVANGISASLEDRDFITSTHAGHLDIMAKGLDTKLMYAEMFGKKTGTNQAYGGSMHMVDVKLGIMGTNGIVGGGYQLGAGAAWWCKVEGKGRVVVTYAGDGANNSGYWFITMRGAQNIKLPWIHLLQNNFQGVSNPIATLSPSPYVADYGVGLGIPAVVVDGNDVTAVYNACSEAVARARADQGPSMIEALTWRWYDHQGFAGAKLGEDAAWGLPYRTDDEVRAWMGRDPIVRYRTYLTEKGFATAAELDGIRTEVKAEMEAGKAFARQSPVQEPTNGVKNAYVGWNPPATQFFEHPVVA